MSEEHDFDAGSEYNPEEDSSDSYERTLEDEQLCKDMVQSIRNAVAAHPVTPLEHTIGGNAAILLAVLGSMPQPVSCPRLILAFNELVDETREVADYIKSLASKYNENIWNTGGGTLIPAMEGLKAYFALARYASQGSELARWAITTIEPTAELYKEDLVLRTTDKEHINYSIQTLTRMVYTVMEMLVREMSVMLADQVGIYTGDLRSDTAKAGAITERVGLRDQDDAGRKACMSAILVGMGVGTSYGLAATMHGPGVDARVGCAYSKAPFSPSALLTMHGDAILAAAYSALPGIAASVESSDE